MRVRNSIFRTVLLLTVCAGFWSAKPGGLVTDFGPVGLTVQSQSAPVGVTEVPFFGWQTGEGKGFTAQTAYRILVASSPGNLDRGYGDLWDSGTEKSEQQHYIQYRGKKLNSSTEYYWKVQVWNQNGRVSFWSPRAFWITGILDERQWKGRWITYDPKLIKNQPLFRKAFRSTSKIRTAVAHISGLGYYELYLNGKKVGDHVLDPAQTDYEKRALYASYDVTDRVKELNMIGVMLGNGFYDQNRVWGTNGLSYGHALLRFQLDLTYTNGEKESVVSDQTWECTNGPILFSNVYAGESFDARMENPDWCKAGDVSTGWLPVSSAKSFPAKLISQQCPPVKRVKELRVKHIHKIGRDTFIYDFGQNFAGWVRLNIRSDKGNEIKMRFAEELGKDGKLDMASTGSFATGVQQSLTYRCRGGGREVWEPRFTYHGFRYVEITGIPPSQAASELLTGIVLRNAVEEDGTFSCSDDQINKLHQLAKWTLEGNLHGVPTDCPTREKCGWLGDAHTFAPMSVYNYDMELFWLKYLQDIRSSASDTLRNIFTNRNTKVAKREGIKPAGIPLMIAPGKRKFETASIDWGTAIVQLPWMVYLYYGNKEVIRDFYPDMERWVAYCRKDLVKENIVYEGLGDWCSPDGVKDCPIEISSTAFHYKDLTIMADVAALLGKKNEHERYKRLKEEVKTAFITKFFNYRTNSFGSQTADALALDFDLIPPAKHQLVSYAIADESAKKYQGFLNTGIFGLQRIFKSLSDHGNSAVAYQLLTKKGANSFEQMWAKHDATTLWEVLPVRDYYEKGGFWPPRQSHNHPMQAGYDAWFFEGVLGIRPDKFAPGFKKIVFKPAMTQQLQWAKGSYQSRFGRILSDWKNEGDTLIWKISIPPNSSGQIHLGHAKKIEVNGRDIKQHPDLQVTGKTSLETVVAASAGTYQFTIYR